MTGSNLFVPGQAPVQVDYALDGMGNRLAVTGGPDAGAYVMSSSLPSPADHQMNQYTSTPLDGARAYDAAGNLVSRTSGASALAYDYRGRLVLVSGSSGSGSYAYDAFGRRVLVDGDRLYYDGMREIEQHSSSGSLERLNVYGPASEILMSVADMDLDGLPDRLHQQTDDLGNVVLVTGPVGEALERYDYGDFGQPRIMNAAGAPLAQSAIGNPFLFGGRRYDGATGLYDAVTRHLDPRAGVFVSRDTLGVWGDPASRGHATAYAAGNPWSCLDPTGRAIENRQTLKTYFETGDVPTQDQFYDARTPLKDRFQDGDIPTQDDFADALIARPVLKSFFQTGDKPTQAQFGALIDSALNCIDDRDLLGLRVTRPVLKSFFQTGDKPTQAQFADTIDSFYYMFEDRDVPELRLLPRTILKSFFQTGDKPTQAQFADTIDSFYYMFEDRDGLELRLLPRTILKSFFQTGDKPTQAQFADTIDSFYYMFEDRDGLELRLLPRTILKSFFQTGDKPTQAQFGALIDSVLHLQTFRWTQVSGPYRFSTRSGE